MELEKGAMEILIAEDEPDIGMQYEIALKANGHTVVVTNDGQSCVDEYKKANEKHHHHNQQQQHPSSQSDSNKRKKLPWSLPFDVVVLDYHMPIKDGLQAAKEILVLNPNQRIIFASAYVRETLQDSVKQLQRVVELLQKPFELQHLIDTIEDKQIFEELQKLNAKIEALKRYNPTHDQLTDLVSALRIIMKERTF